MEWQKEKEDPIIMLMNNKRKYNKCKKVKEMIMILTVGRYGLSSVSVYLSVSFRLLFYVCHLVSTPLSSCRYIIYK